MTGYHDYLIVLAPTESVVKRIKRYKEDSAGIIGEYDGRHSKAHITVQFWPRKKPVWIEPLVPKLERELLGLPPLTTVINGFDFFQHEDSYTIYARLEQTEITSIWYKQLKRFFGGGKFVPHITIARSITPAQFNKLWPYLNRQQWHEEFKVDKLTILRREMIGHDKNYTKFKEMPFNSRMDINTYAKAKLKAPVVAVKTVNHQQFSLF